MSDAEELKPKQETPEFLITPKNESKIPQWSEVSGRPEEEKQQDTKTSFQAKKPKILKVVINRPKKLATMKSFKCTECGQSFKEKSALVKHLKIHTGKRPYQCKTCGKILSKKSSLVIHQQTHMKGKSFTCKKCGKTFGQRSNLITHNKTHIQKKPNNSKNSTRASKYTKLMKKHKEKPYKCLQCKKMFVLHKNFVKHQKTHVGEMPYNPGTGSCVENKGRAQEQTVDFSGLMLEELRKMRENVDMLLLNQQSQLQVLQGIQKQLGVLLPGNDLLNSNVYSLGLLLSQQSATMGLSSFPLLSPSNLLPESAYPLSSRI